MGEWISMAGKAGRRNQNNGRGKWNERRKENEERKYGQQWKYGEMAYQKNNEMKSNNNDE